MVETQDHMFHCQNEQLKLLRATHWNLFSTKLCQNTDKGFTAVFMAGLNTVVGGATPTNETISQWPPPLQEVYAVQTDIGWQHILYGRLAKGWDKEANYRWSQDSSRQNGVWIGRAIRLCRDFGIEFWTIRNQMVHGTVEGISTGERQQVKELIRAMYRHVIPTLEGQLRQVFTRPEKELLLIPYQCQLAWLGRLKFVVPMQYREVEKQERGRRRSQQEVDYIHLKQVDTGLRQNVTSFWGNSPFVGDARGVLILGYEATIRLFVFDSTRVHRTQRHTYPFI